MTNERDATTDLTMTAATDTTPAPESKATFNPFHAGDDVVFAGDVEIVTAVDQGDPSEEEDDIEDDDFEDDEDEDDEDEDGDDSEEDDDSDDDDSDDELEVDDDEV